MNRQCLKCNHLRTDATGDELEACPACGAIYSRVEAAMAPRKVRSSSPLEFIDTLRSESIYPTFRALVQLGYLVWVALAILTLLAGIFVFLKGTGFLRFGGLLVGMGMAAFIYIMGRLMRELSLMLADLSDASVKTSAILAAQEQSN